MARRFLDLSDPRIETFDDARNIALALPKLLRAQEQVNDVRSDLDAIKDEHGIDIDTGWLCDMAEDIGWTIEGLKRAQDRYCEAEDAA